MNYSEGVYIAPDLTFCSNEPGSAISRMAAAGLVWAFVCRQAGGRTGFGVHAPMDVVVSRFLKLTWVYDADAGFLRPGADFGERVLSVACSPVNGGIAINAPDTTLREQDNELLKAYRKAMKVFALKKRLAHAAAEPAMPTLAKLGIGTAAPALLDYLHEHCGFMLLWGFSEFGAYFRTTNGSLDGKSYMVEMFMAEGIRVFEVETMRELPVW